MRGIQRGAADTPAANSRRRRLNEDRRRRFGRSGRMIAFICECADSGCRSSVLLRPDEYDVLRRTPPGLLLQGGHRATVSSTS